MLFLVRWSISECARKGWENSPQNQRIAMSRALTLIRFPLIPVEEFAINVGRIGILTESELVKLFMNFNISTANM